MFRSLVHFAIIITVVVGLTGCGGSSSTATSDGSSAQALSVGTVVVTVPDVATASATAPTAIRFTGTDGAGTVLYGPVTLSARRVMTLTDIPSSVTSLLIEPLTGGRPTDAFAFRVTIGAVPFEIPNGLDPAAHATSLSVTPAPVALVVGATQQLTATGAFPDGSRHDVTGTVTWGVSPSTLATISRNGLATATAAGVGSFTATLDSVNGSAAVTITGTATTTTLAASVSPTVAGQPVTLTATVAASSGTPDGTVTFRDGSTTLGTSTLANGTATLTTASLSVGSHALTATYSGASTFAASTSSSLTQTVNPDVGGASVGSSQNPSVRGQAVIFTAIVTAAPPGTGTPTGTVTFKDGATVLAANVALDPSGQATTSVSTLSLGTHSITVLYSGDGSFTPSTSSPLVQTVNKAASTTTLGSSANPSANHQSVTFTATVTATAPGSGTPTGSVTFTDGITVLGTAALNAGVATLTTSSLTVGTHAIAASYGGDASFTASASATLAQQVNLTFTSRTSGTANNLNAICFGGGIFAAAGDAATVRTSTDGITWAASTVGGAQNFLAIAYNGGFGLTGDQSGRLWYSANGASGSWNTIFGISLLSDVNYAIGVGNGFAVAVGISTAQPDAITSPDNPPFSASGGNSATGTVLRGVTNGGGTRFVGVGNGGGIAYADVTNSTPTWTAATSPTANQLNAVASNGQRFVAVGNSGTIVISTDATGTAFTSVTSGTTANLRGITFGDALYLVTGDNGTILVSSDGVTWSAQTSGTTANLNAATFANGGFVVVGSGGTVLTSF